MGTRVIALYLVLTGLAVAVYFIAVSWQYSGIDQPYPVEAYPVWEMLHWFMAAAILIALLSVFARKLDCRNPSRCCAAWPGCRIRQRRGPRVNR